MPPGGLSKICFRDDENHFSILLAGQILYQAGVTAGSRFDTLSKLVTSCSQALLRQFQDSTWQSRRLFWADLGQEQEVLDRRCTMVAPEDYKIVKT